MYESDWSMGSDKEKLRPGVIKHSINHRVCHLNTNITKKYEL